jgi:hypothetical protein
VLADSPSPAWVNLLLGPGGLLVGLMIVIYTGVRKMWVFGWMYAEKSKEADRWRDMALRGTSLAATTLRHENETEAS